jgi:hypothetical protein
MIPGGIIVMNMTLIMENLSKRRIGLSEMRQEKRLGCPRATHAMLITRNRYQGVVAMSGQI